MHSTRPADWRARVARALAAGEAGDAAAALGLLVEGLRPERGEDPTPRLRALCAFLETQDDGTPLAVGDLVRRFVRESHAFGALTGSGVTGEEGVLHGVLARVGRRILPPVPSPTDLRDRVRAVFHAPGDHVWVGRVPDEEWRRLLQVTGITAESVVGVGEELARALQVLASHASSLGLRAESAKADRVVDPAGSPFLEVAPAVLRYLASWENEVEGDEEPLLDDALAVVAACRREVHRLRDERRVHGTSLWFTGLSARLLELLERLDLLLHLTEPVERDFQGCAVRIFKQVVQAEKTRDHLAPHVRASVDLLALEIVDHAARKGSKYIATGRRDYRLFLLSSMGGGLLVALFSLAKVVMTPWEVPLAVEAFLYGINYALCFVLIYLSGATLATKQPAMTANTVARSLGADGDDLQGLEEMVVRVWRSQFISFVGNVIVALPVAFLLSELVFQASGDTVAGPEKAESMLAALHPWRSGTVAYAAVAGVLLFAAGLISGWVDNGVRQARVPARLARLPPLVRRLGPAGADKVAKGLDRHLGAVVGNVFLGFGLGSMGTVGEILGLPLDIRHIAFASAEFGTALEILHLDVPLDLVAAVALGVALIGLVNFLVSFGLSLSVALESRSLGWRATRRLWARLGRRALRRPLDFFLPPRSAPGRPGGWADPDRA